MNRPTYNEARPAWRRTGDVETYVPPGMSAAERRARARQDGAPASQPQVTMQGARRTRSERSMAPAPPPAGNSTETPREIPGKSPGKSQRGTGTTQAILDVLAAAGRPMTYSEVVAALNGRASPGSVSGTMVQLRQRGVLLQDAKRGPYRLPAVEPAPPPTAVSISVPSDEAEKINTPPENTHAELAKLVTQLRNERDAARSKLAEMRARWRVMAREMHVLGAQWGDGQ